MWLQRGDGGMAVAAEGMVAQWRQQRGWCGGWRQRCKTGDARRLGQGPVMRLRFKLLEMMLDRRRQAERGGGAARAGRGG